MYALHKPAVLVNGDMRPSEMQKFCQLDKLGLAMIRTIADLAGSEGVQQAHLAEPPQY